MKQHHGAVPISGRQMSLTFEPRKVDVMKDAERAEVVMALVQLLMQAAGLIVEELDDDRR